MCGIFGFIGQRQKPFDKRAFVTLGVANDARGGDSCGIFIDGQYEYGVDKLKLFNDFWYQSKLIKETKSATIALGHDRKASVGGVKAELAQPVIINGENGPEFVFIHNGTMVNHTALAKKYLPDMDTANMSDSQIMANIFYRHGFDSIEEYIGAAVFVAVDYRSGKPVSYFFKGESKEYSYSTKATEERPLFFTTSHQQVCFSSIYSTLAALFPDKALAKNIYFPNGNTLYTVDPYGDINVVKEYDRSKCYQKESYTSSAYNYYRYNRNADFDDEESYYGYYRGENNNNISTNLLTPGNNGKLTFDSKTMLYYEGDDVAHGLYYVVDDGTIVPARTANAFEAFFFNGVLIKNADALFFLIEFMVTMQLTEDKVFEKYDSLVRYLSPLPAVSLGDDGTPTFHKYVTPTECELFSGTMFPLFAGRSIMCQAGIVSSSTLIADSVGENIYKKFSEEPINMELLDDFLDSIVNEVENNK